MISHSLFGILLFLFCGVVFGIQSLYIKKEAMRPSVLMAARLVMGTMSLWAVVSLILYFINK
jgi:drug/metabolite transporter (DMT)-like permease